MNHFRRFHYIIQMIKWMKNRMKRVQCCFLWIIKCFKSIIWAIYIPPFIFEKNWKVFSILPSLIFQSQARPRCLMRETEWPQAPPDKQWFQCGYLVSSSSSPPISYTNHMLCSQYHHLISSESNEYSIDLQTSVQNLAN